VLTIENTGASDLDFVVNTVQTVPVGKAAAAASSGPIATPGQLASKASAASTRIAVASKGSSLDDATAPLDRRAQATDGSVELILLSDDFEDGDMDGWLDAGGTGLKEVTSATAAGGTTFSYHEFSSGAGHHDGIYQTMGPSQPAHVSFWVRSGSQGDNDAYFVLRDSAGLPVIVFYAMDNGRFGVNALDGGSNSYTYTANTWYHIEFRDIDFVGKRFNFYVNDTAVYFGVPMKNAAAIEDVDRLELYNYDSNSEAWWDEIVIATDPFLDWLTAEPEIGTVLPDSTAEITVTFDATGLAEGQYTADIVVFSNDPAQPEVTVPVVLDVIADADVVEIAMGHASGIQGAAVSVPFAISRPNLGPEGDPAQTAGVDLTVTWDPAIATLLDVSLTPATSDWLMEFNPGAGTVTVSMATINPIDVPLEGIDFLTFDFQLASADGTTPLSIVDSRVFDLAQDPITHAAVDGSLTVGCVKGDVIPDGEINSADAIRGLLISVGLVQPTPQELCAADMNMDGVVDVGDIVLILQKAVGIDPMTTDAAEPARLFVRAGDEIGDVLLRVENLAGLDLVMKYDPSAVTFISASAPGAQALVAANDQSPGTVRLAFAKHVAYEGDIRLKFDVNEPHSTLLLQSAIAFDEEGAKGTVEMMTTEFTFGVTGVISPQLGHTRLMDAAPNPFNPMTQLRFVLAKPGDARLTVYNVAGRRVRDFQMRGLSAGEHHVTWDGRDATGARVASGSYLIRFEAEGKTDTGRVMLLK
jgi:hypothetical protein